MISFDTSDPVVILQKVQEYQAENPDDQCVIFNLTGPPIVDVKGFILTGFLPTNSSFYSFIEAWLIEGLSMREISEWDEIDADQMIRNLSETEGWQYCTIGEWIKRGARNPFSLPLILYGHDLVYSSMRPKTTMSLYQSPGYLTAKRSDIRYTSPGMGFWTDVNGQTWNVAAVTRYAAGMSRGLYHGETGGFCGTFYYFEPESTTYLAYQTSLVAKNKNLAFKTLLLLTSDSPVTSEDVERFKIGEDFIARGMNLDPEVYYSYYRVLFQNRGKYGDLAREIAEYDKEPHNIYSRDFTDPLPEDLTMTLDDFQKSHHFGLPKRKRYIGVKLGFYGIEDSLDQIICLTGKALGIDVFHLTHMIGSHQIVHEILDTRPRVESFKSLIYLTD